MRSRAFVVLSLALVTVALGLGVMRWLAWADVDYEVAAKVESASIAGRAVDGDGRPIAGAKVAWLSQAGDRAIVSTAFGEVASTTTAADGGFRFDAVAPVEGFVAMASATGYEGSSGFVLPKPGFVAANLQLRAKAVDGSRRLRGRVCDERGAPVESLFVQARVAGWLSTWQGSAMTDADGRFEILCPGSGDVAMLTGSLRGTGPQVDLGRGAAGKDLRLVVAAGK